MLVDIIGAEFVTGMQRHPWFQPCSYGSSQGTHITILDLSVDIMIFSFLTYLIFQQLMASRSDALFKDAKSKLLEIRSQHSKRLEARTDTREETRRKKKSKK